MRRGGLNELIAVYLDYRSPGELTIALDLDELGVSAPRAMANVVHSDDPQPCLWLGQSDGRVACIKYALGIESCTIRPTHDWEAGPRWAWTGEPGADRISDLHLLDVDGDGLSDIMTMGPQS